MVEFGGRYYIDPAQVEYISETDRAGAIVADSHPYDLTVHLLSGKSLGLCYPTKLARDTERRKLVTAIQRERTNYEETMLCKLRLIQNDVSRIDKRQLRVWQQLKKLLGIQPEE